MALYRSLTDLSLQDLAEYGGKAARLGEAARLGCPVLPGVVLSTELYRRFMRQGGLQSEIAGILNTMQPSTLTHFKAAEWAIAAAFAVRRLPDEVAAVLRAARAELGDMPLAVRSSATREDGLYHSFVGQHDTYLDVRDEAALIEAVVGCWRSLYSAKALAYARRFRLDLLHTAMAVILQPMVQAEARGTLVDVHPVTGNPDAWLLEVRDGPEASLHALDPYARAPGEPDYWDKLRGYGLRLGDHFGAYQAIDWSVAEGSLWIGRVRPVTGTPPYIPRNDVHIGAGAPVTLCRREGVTARALRPYSWYHRSLSGRMNAAHHSRASRLFSPLAWCDEYYVQGYLYQRAQPPRLSRSWRVTGPLNATILDLACLLATRRLDREWRALRRRHRPTLDQLCDGHLAALSARDLAAALARTVDTSEAFWVERGRLGDSHQRLAAILQRLTQRWTSLSSEDVERLLWTGEDQMTRCQVELCELSPALASASPEAEATFRVLYRRYRHLFLRGDPLGERQDIRDLQNDEPGVRALLAEWSRGERPTVCLESGQRAAQRDALEHRALAQLGPGRAAIYRYVLRWARRYAPLRRDRDEPILLCYLLQHDMVLEAGRRLRLAGLAAQPDEAFLLTYREVVDWLGGNLKDEQTGRLLIERRAVERRWWRYSPPETLAATLPPAPDTARAAATAEMANAESWQGLAVAAGVASGPARLITTLAEATHLVPGEVLVCHEALFELIPLFDMAAALVAETGGPLDHAGVLAREYGLPAVFGVVEATRKIRTGDTLLVDANRGLVVRHLPEVYWDGI
ncbi:MAG: PEP/pyruvate-binding domain-containing protein [Chloroflexota bacterium]